MKARNANRTAAVAAMALLAMSVSGPAQAASKKDSDMDWLTASKVGATTLTHGLRSDYTRPTLLVVQNSCQWQAAMATLAANHALMAGAQAEPAGVDWKHQAVVVVALGEVPYGYDLDVREVRAARGKLLLDVHVDYQSYENSLEDVSPVQVLLVNGTGMGKVRALYDLDTPGLVSQSAAPSCEGEDAPAMTGSGSVNGSDSGTTLTWGAMKSLYR